MYLYFSTENGQLGEPALCRFFTGTLSFPIGTVVNPPLCLYLGRLGSRVVSACWTQAQKGPGSNRSRDAVG